MIPFDWAEPETLKEAAALLDPDDPTIRPIAGGTALMLMMKAGVFTPSRLVSLAKIEPRYSEIGIDAGGVLRIGAMVSLSQLEQSAEAISRFPVMKRALRTLSNVRVRNVARIGGALAHGDPHMDLPPLLAALGARVSVMGLKATREIAVEDLYSGYYETTLEKNELIAEAIVPPLNGAKAAYMKVTSRSADDWPALNIGVCLHTDGARTREARIIISAATEKVTRLRETEELLTGAAVNDALLKQAGDVAAREVSFLSDAHGSAAYKKELLRVYLARAIREALS
ncbi:MAG: aerobic carbon-monoxide dehydrogenase medium subunit [Alphaproteobacteria bacterium]|nr:aerobic carbon-monoxide dehydrogenase medium subunit [Alphaproteobacteria bacterium]